jgi:antitoxin MazE
MATLLKTRIIKIGNSQGIRIPKLLLQQLGIADEVEMEASANTLLIRPIQHVRHGWDEKFQQMSAQGDDQLLDVEFPLTQFEENEWEW